MPNTKSAIRRVRRVKSKQLLIEQEKGRYKNAIKKMEGYLKSNSKDKAKKFFPSFQSILMQVAKTGVVNKKTAARKISRVQKNF